MVIINLRKIFPVYELDCFVEVPDEDVEVYVNSLTKEIADVYINSQRKENASLRQVFRYKAHYSLDSGDGIEYEVTAQTADPFEILMDKLDKAQLFAALNSLPGKQLNRIYAFYFLGMSKAEIARNEGIDEKNVRQSLERGIATLKKLLGNQI